MAECEGTEGRSGNLINNVVVSRGGTGRYGQIRATDLVGGTVHACMYQTNLGTLLRRPAYEGWICTVHSRLAWVLCLVFQHLGRSNT